MADPLRHRQTKGAATDMVDLTPPRHIPTLPRAAVVARSMVGPVRPQLRKCHVCPGSYAWCHIRTFTANEVVRAKKRSRYASSVSSSALASFRSGVSKPSVNQP